MIQQGIIKDVPELQETMMAPFAGETIFIIDKKHVIINREVHEDYWDEEYHSNLIEIEKEIE